MQTRNTLIMAAVLVALGAFVYLYEIRGREARETAADDAALLVHVDPAEVTGVRVTTAEGTVRATKADGVWSIVEPAPVAADGAALDKLVDELSRSKQDRLIAEAVEDLTPFGLAEPEALVVFERGDAELVTLAVGKNTPVGTNVYATVNDTGDVYSALPGVRVGAKKTLLDLRNRQVLEFASGTVTAIEYSTGDLSAALSKSAAGDWSATTPFVGRADDDTIDDLLSSLAAAQAEGFVLDAAPDSAAMAQFGLDAPRARISLRDTDDAVFGLLVGAESESPAGHYAMRDGGNAVFVVDAALMEDLPADALSLRNKQVVDLARERVGEITLERPGAATIRLARNGVDWTIVEPRVLEADASAVSRILSTLQDLRAEGFASSGSGPVTTRLTLGLRDPGADDAPVQETVSIELSGTTSAVPFDERDDEDAEAVEVVHVATGGDTVYLVDNDSADGLRLDLFELRSKTLVEFDADEITSIEISTGAGVTHTVTREGDGWRLAEGEFGDANPADLQWDVNYLRMVAVAREWEGAAPALAEYGLDVPRLRIVVNTAAGVVADVRLGNEVAATEEGSGRVYALVGERRAVFEISTALADTLATFVDALR